MLSCLVIDDDPVAQAYFEAVLRDHALAPITCADAAAAIEHLDREPFDLCLIDWMMPGLSGIDLVRQIRSGRAAHSTYIIMLTARGSDSDLAQAFDAGVDDFIAKPVRTVEIGARLKAAFRIIGAQHAMGEQLAQITDLNAELRLLASEDPLTGLLNRRAGLERLCDAWLRARRYDEPLAVAVIDLDHFKGVNDRFGHEAGDSALRHVASILRAHTRESDIVMRLGGEEFLIVYPATDAPSAATHMDRVRRVLEAAPLVADEFQITLTLSAGVCGRSPAFATPEALLAAADAAMYAAKGAGRNRVSKAA